MQSIPWGTITDGSSTAVLRADSHADPVLTLLAPLGVTVEDVRNLGGSGFP